MKKILFLMLAATLVMPVGCKKAEEPKVEAAVEDRVVAAADDDRAVNTAIEEARSTVDEFIKALNGEIPGTSDHTIKAAVKDGDDVEHFWLVDVTFDGTTFSGKIDNTPQVVKNVKEGELYKVPKTEISDWMYFKDGVAVGNRTLKAMFPRMNPAEVADIKKSLGWQ